MDSEPAGRLRTMAGESSLGQAASSTLASVMGFEENLGGGTALKSLREAEYGGSCLYPSTPKAEAGGSVSSRLAWFCVNAFRPARATQ